jgi:hypothetical protein
LGRRAVIHNVFEPRLYRLIVADDGTPIMPTDWWANIFTAMTSVNFSDLLKMESTVDKDTSWQDLALLMECADHHQFLQHAYEQRKRGMLHVEFVIDTD